MTTATARSATGIKVVTSPTLDELRAHGRDDLAGYKLPKHLVLVDRVQRTPAGKADYRWATEAARAAVGADGTEPR